MTLSVQAERPITFHSKGQPALLLEGVVHTPPKIEKAPIIILCHPQPASSDMNDSLNIALARSLAEAGMVAFRFNFRGVGRSQGQQTDGRLEPLDLAGAIETALTFPGIDPSKLCVIGHGFGAYTTMLYAPFDNRIRTIVAISLPIFRASGGFPRSFERPKLFVTGEFDEVCPRFKLEPFVEQQKGPKGIKIIVGARHLMHGFEEPAIQAILSYLQKWASMPGI
ncbi:alpha/beta hydrolase [Dictyobacter arantiisoli]|uniref:Alpha/beta hydrolase n=1 Tax=Dictyobacter arantiisoli TaxID=2014874 RepID=A0A5A5TKS2_9CHLR|nr:alpha/beta fold hydrolase [Dictyobacter arantiisoli]GCF11514.1 alpha/beta hydrolase [Dictyobacter arantiisoli]